MLLAGSGSPASADEHSAVAGQSWCGRPDSPPPCAHPSTRRRPRPTTPLLHCLPRLRHCIDWAADAAQKPQARCGAPTRATCPAAATPDVLPMVRAPCPIAADEPRRALDDTATHWSADNPTHLGGYQADANVRSGRANAPPARGPTPDPARPHAPLSLHARRLISEFRLQSLFELLQVTAPWSFRHRRRACNQAQTGLSLQTGALPTPLRAVPRRYSAVSRQPRQAASAQTCNAPRWMPGAASHQGARRDSHLWDLRTHC